MTTEEVDRIARGRIWTGKQALENGLVDELGGLKSRHFGRAKTSRARKARSRAASTASRKLACPMV